MDPPGRLQQCAHRSYLCLSGWSSCQRLIPCTPNPTRPAAPAVSRAGIIYVSDTELGWQPVVASWLQTRHEREAAALRACFDKFVDPLFDFIRWVGPGLG